ncbi:hypothetical protein D3C72_1824680 [compost metagenome]
MRASFAWIATMSKGTLAAGMPTSTRQPPGHSRSNTLSKARALPLASKTTFAPQPSVRACTVSARLVLRTSTVVTAGLWANSASFSGTRSARITRAAPPASAASAVIAPMVPAPMTTATSPGFSAAFFAACRPMASGSTMAPSPKLTLSGRRKVKAAGCTT